MTLLFVLLIVVLLPAGLFQLAKIMADHRRKQLFKPLTRAAYPHPSQDALRIDRRRRAGSVCFVTGMPGATCACANCQGEGR
jgi:hypothetical protein